MLGRYAPQLAVHSHLPAPPTTPHAIPVWEAPIDRSFPTSSSAYDSPLHPDHALYTAGEASTGVQARVIQNGYTLELRSYQLSTSSASSSSQLPTAVRITFPEPLAPLSSTCITTAFNNAGQSYLYVVLLASSGWLYRLRFARSAKYALEGGPVQTFVQGDEWFEHVELPSDKIHAAAGITTHAVVTEDLFLVGCGDGGVLKVEKKDGFRNSDGV